MTGSNPLDWYGAEFLAFFAVCFVLCWLLGYPIAAWLRASGTPGHVENPYELAVLSGRPTALAETALARMMDAGLVSVLENKEIVRQGGAPRDGVEARILEAGSHTRFGKAVRAVREEGDRMREVLIQRGLMIRKGDAFAIGIGSALPLIVLLILGATKYNIGVERERPVGFLAAFLIFATIVTLFRVAKVDRRTKAGIAAFKEARNRNARLRIAPRGSETGTAVALFGTGVIATSAIGDLHRLKSNSANDGGGGGCSGGDGGCGGGGCGGCGS